MKELKTLYEESLQWAIERSQKSRTIAIGFHSVVDGLVRNPFKKLGNVLPSQEVPKNWDELPQSIKTTEDFYKGLIFSFARGKALQIMIDSKEVYEWIMERFGSGKMRLGGTSANMAKTLSEFPFRKILVYAYPMSKELASLFPKSDNLFIVHDDALRHPKDIKCENGVKAIHWIFEFSEGEKIKIGNKTYTCPRSNRFIASWNPVNSRLEVREPFRTYVLEHAGEISHFLISGFHIMKESYPNGESVEDRMRELKKFVELVKKNNPTIRFHLEFASIRRDRVRKAVERILFPVFDSLGANEVELTWIAKDLGLDATGIENGDVEKISDVLLTLVKRGIKRVHFHTLGFYLLAFEEGTYDIEEQKRALAFAALAAAQRAKDGYTDTSKIPEMLKIPLSNMKYSEWEENGVKFVLFPTKVVKNQKVSVGLGDTISSLGFVLG